jgi:hypothetical protein
LTENKFMDKAPEPRPGPSTETQVTSKPVKQKSITDFFIKEERPSQLISPSLQITPPQIFWKTRNPKRDWALGPKRGDTISVTGNCVDTAQD